MSAQWSEGRDGGLDILRAFALVLMLSAHFSRSFPVFTDFAKGLIFLWEAAPAFFFVAFGMTLDRFFAKDRGAQIRQSGIFLAIALAHSCFVHKPFQMDFLLFLWVWQALLSGIFQEVKLTPKRLFIAIAMVVPALFFVGPARITDAFKFTGGPFPLLPWGLFIFFGMILKKAGTGHRVFAGALFAAVASTLLSIMATQSAASRFIAIKSPMTGTYFLLFAALSVLVYLCGGWMAPSLAKINLFRKGTIFLSRYLLLGTALHYAAYLTVDGIVMKLVRVINRLDVRRVDFLVLIFGAAAALCLLFGLMKIALMLWPRMKELGTFQFLRKHFRITAFLLLVIQLGFFFFINGSMRLVSEPAANVGNANIPAFCFKAYGLALMTYFTMEWMGRKSGQNPAGDKKGIE